MTVEVQATLDAFFEAHAVHPTHAYVTPRSVETVDGHHIGVFFWMGHEYRYDLDTWAFVSLDGNKQEL